MAYLLQKSITLAVNSVAWIQRDFHLSTAIFLNQSYVSEGMKSCEKSPGNTELSLKGYTGKNNLFLKSHFTLRTVFTCKNISPWRSLVRVNAVAVSQVEGSEGQAGDWKDTLAWTWMWDEMRHSTTQLHQHHESQQHHAVHCVLLQPLSQSNAASVSPLKLTLTSRNTHTSHMNTPYNTHMNMN